MGLDFMRIRANFIAHGGDTLKREKDEEHAPGIENLMLTEEDTEIRV